MHGENYLLGARPIAAQQQHPIGRNTDLRQTTSVDREGWKERGLEVAPILCIGIQSRPRCCIAAVTAAHRHAEFPTSAWLPDPYVADH